MWRDLRHGWRMLATAPVLERGGHRLARHRHRRQHGGVLVDAGVRADAAARRAAGRGVPPRRAARPRPAPTRAPPGSSSRTLRTRLAGDRRPDGVPHGAAQRRRGRAAPSAPSRCWCRRAISAPSACARCSGRVLAPDEVSAAGSAPVAVVSHRFWQSRLAGDPAAIGRTRPRQRRRAGGRRRAARRLPGHRARPAVRSLGAGDDGAGGARRFARARRSASRAATTVMGAAGRGRLVARRQADGDRRCASWRGQYPESNRDVARRGAAVLAGAARAAADVLPGAERAAGPDAGAAARGLRQHRHAAAGAIGVAPARARASAWPSARRRGGWRGCCSPRALVIGARAAPSLGALLAAWGVAGAARRPAHHGAADPVPDLGGRDRAGRGARARPGAARSWWRSSPALQALRGSTSRPACRPARGRRRPAGGDRWRWQRRSALAMAVLIVAGLFLPRSPTPAIPIRVRAPGRPARRLRPLGARR